jgi:hypothetical protein
MSSVVCHVWASHEITSRRRGAVCCVFDEDGTCIKKAALIELGPRALVLLVFGIRV